MAEELQVDSVWTGADVVTMRGGRYAMIERGGAGGEGRQAGVGRRRRGYACL